MRDLDPLVAVFLQHPHEDQAEAPRLLHGGEESDEAEGEEPAVDFLHRHVGVVDGEGEADGLSLQLDDEGELGDDELLDAVLQPPELAVGERDVAPVPAPRGCEDLLDDGRLPVQVVFHVRLTHRDPVSPEHPLREGEVARVELLLENARAAPERVPVDGLLPSLLLEEPHGSKGDCARSGRTGPCRSPV